MKIEVVYATAESAASEVLELPVGTTVETAVAASRFASTPAAAFAVFGKPVTGNHELEDGARIELLRELLTDPMDARRERAADRMRPDSQGVT